jgi:septum formation protein
MDIIILASGSPRRRDLLQKAKIPFKVIPPNISEEAFLIQATKKTAVDIAKKKAEAIISLFKQESPRWILAADTLIEIDGQIIGKPAGIEQAEVYLKLLNGQVHKVHTGLALLPERGKHIQTQLCSTEVKFREMTRDEIQFYLDSGEWAGAAGGYRIQEQGGFFVDWVKGSYSNVVGLPLETVYKMLKENGYIFTHP